MAQERGYWQRRLSRRRVLQGAALGGAGLAAAAVIGCGEEEKPAAAPTGTRAPAATAVPASPAATPTPAARQPKRGGTLTRRSPGTGVFDTGLDPHVLTAAQMGIHGLFYQSLIRLNPRTFQVEQEIGQKWEQPAPTEYIFTLAPGIKWQNRSPVNGRELTADDVIFSLNRLRTEQPRFINRSLLANVDKIEAVNRSTVKVVTKGPDVGTLVNLAAFPMKVVAQEAMEKFEGKFNTADSAVGTGAFILQSFDPTSAEVVRNPEYWKRGLPYLDRVRIVNIPDDNTLWAAFLAKQIDVNGNLPGAEAKKVIADQSKPYGAAWFNDVSFTGGQPNLARKPFDDPRVYKALKLLIDYQQAANDWGGTWFGRGYLTAALCAAIADWDFTEQEYASKFLAFKQPKDQAAREAISLLKAAGFEPANPVKLEILGVNVGFLKAGAEILQDQFRRHGQGAVEATIKLADLPTWNARGANRDFDLFWDGLVPPMPFEPDSWFSTFYHSRGSRNYGKYSNSALDGLIDKQKTVFDVPQRKGIVKEILSHIVEQTPHQAWGGRFQGNAWQSHVKDWAPEANSAIWGYQYEHVWLDT